MRSRAFYLEIFLVSLAVILLEISYTRIFSFKLYYYFTYLIIGISLLGLGSGGVFVAILPRLRGARPSRVIVACCLAASVAIAIGYFFIALVRVDALAITSRPFEGVKLAFVLLFLFAPFLAAGVVIATIFGARPHEINRLYCADLLGAGLGCVSCIPLIYLLTPPGCVMLSSLVFGMAGLRLALEESRRLAGAIVGVAAVVALTVFIPSVLPDPRPDSSKTLGHSNPEVSPVIFSQWSSVFRVDVMDHPNLEGASYLISHDGQMGSGIHRFNGDLSTLKRFDSDPRLFPFRVGKKNPNVVIIGAAGGHEIIASLYFDAEHVTGVELNPVTTSLLTKHFADYSGRLAENPKVSLFNAEGRSFLKGSGEDFDLIWLVAPDSYAAMNAATSGAFVLSESYLYTKQMLLDSFDHLRDDGMICAMFGELVYDQKPNRTARYVSTARAAFAERGIDDFGQHVLIATSPSFITLSTILLKKTPFTPEEVDHFVRAAGEVPGSIVRYAPGTQVPPSPVNDIVTLPAAQLFGWYARYPYDVAPVTDNAPFFWHFSRFRDAFSSSPLRHPGFDLEDALGERLLVILLVFVVVFAAVFLLLPFLSLGRIWSQIPYKGNAAVYFASLGVGFMFLEVSLIQMLTLFLGYPSYSLSVTLFSLLIFTGLGSLATSVYGAPRNNTLIGLLAALTVLVLFYQFGLSSVVDRFVGAPIVTRFAIAVAVIAPLGLILGAFMPIGLGTIANVTDYKTEFVAWCWAVNGFFSVMSSILSTIIAMSYGFRVVLLAALLVYCVGVVFLIRIPAPAEAVEERASAA
jgi:hypothetical protein